MLFRAVLALLVIFAGILPGYAAVRIDIPLACENTSDTDTILDLSGAVSTYLSFGAAGMNDGDQTWYQLRNGTQKAEGFGTYHSGSPNTFTRDANENSSDGLNTPLSLGGSSIICIGSTSGVLTDGLAILDVDSVVVTTEAYDATGWNGDNTVPTKDAVRDKIETMQPLDSDLTSIAGISWVQGDIPYLSGTNTWERLPKNTSATRYLSNTGTSNNPAWAQVDLSNGVTGTLPIGGGGTGQTTAGAAIGALINGATEDTSPDLSADFVGTYDASASTGKKVLLSKLADIDVQTFTSSGTWTKPSRGKVVFVQCWGGGGGGAFHDSGNAGGGGGGAYNSGWFAISDLGSTETVTIGAGGAGKSTDSNGVGAAGGTTTFGTWLSAYGGGGGGNRATNSAAGGGGGGGQLSAGGSANSSGSAGAAGNIGSPFSTAGTTNAAVTAAFIAAGGGGVSSSNQGTSGGDAVWGGAGGAGVGLASPGTGGTSVYGGKGGDSSSGATAPGGGGGGSRAWWSSGGSGGDGKCIVRTF